MPRQNKNKKKNKQPESSTVAQGAAPPTSAPTTPRVDVAVSSPTAVKVDGDGKLEIPVAKITRNGVLWGAGITAGGAIIVAIITVFASGDAGPKQATTGDNSPIQSTTGTNSPIVTTGPGSTVNFGKEPERLTPNEYAEIEDRMNKVGALAAFELKTDADYEQVHDWLSQFVETKNRVNLTPAIFIVTIKQPNGDKSMNRYNAVDARALLDGHRLEKKYGATVTFTPDAIITVRGYNTLPVGQPAP
jgi:hypothetical protein